jgi:hypothetical protein
MTIPRLAVFAFAGAMACSAATAFVQCESDRAGNGWIELKFRHSLVAGWRIESALLFLHHQSGERPQRLDVSEPGEKTAIRFEARPEDNGWISIALPKALAGAILRKGASIRWKSAGVLDGAGVPGRAPYVVVTGVAVK